MFLRDPKLKQLCSYHTLATEICFNKQSPAGVVVAKGRATWEEDGVRGIPSHAMTYHLISADNFCNPQHMDETTPSCRFKTKTDHLLLLIALRKYRYVIKKARLLYKESNL